MPIRDVAAMNASLDNDYGATHGPNAPAAHEVAFYFGDPALDGVELESGEVDEETGETLFGCPGYARVEISNDDGWPPAEDGSKSRQVAFPATTGEWDLAPTHWALLADGVMWDYGELAEPLEVTSAGDGPALLMTVMYDDSIELED